MAGECGSSCPTQDGFYSYKPTMAGNAVLLAAFAILVPVILFQGVRCQAPWSSSTVTAGLLAEVLAFLGRIVLSGSPKSPSFFALFMLGSVIGPSCMSAGVFQALPRLLKPCGDWRGVIRPLYVAGILQCIVLVALAIQIAGCVFVGFAPGSLGRMGGANIVAAGLAVQSAALMSFIIALALFTWHSLRRNDEDQKPSVSWTSVHFRGLLLGSTVAALFLLAHSVYRIIEMTGGVEGSLFQNEIAFMITGGVFPLLSAGLLAILLPGIARLPGPLVSASYRQKQRRARPTPLERNAHHRYDPDIRKQISPASQRSRRTSGPPELPAGSPGLPANPRVTKSPMPSPAYTAGTVATVGTRSVRAPEKRSDTATKKMVDSDLLW